MANSGQTTILAEQSGNKKTYLEFNWQLVSSDIFSNSSTVNWWIRFYGVDDGYSNRGQENYSVNVNGSVYEGRTNITIGKNESKIILSKTTNIAHTADGTKTFSYSFSVDVKEEILGATVTGTGTGKLNRIDRSAHITGATSFNDEENPTITYSNPSQLKTTSLQVGISFDGRTINVPYRDIGLLESSYTFNLTDNERRALRRGATSGSQTIRFYIKSIVEGITYIEYISSTFSVINYEPTLSPIVRDSNARTIALTGNNKKFIRYYSNAYFETGAQAYKEATITDQFAASGGQTINERTGTFQAVNSDTVYFGVMDSRGFAQRETVYLDIVPYIKLTSSLSLGLLTPNGTVDFTIGGKYFDGSFGAQENEMEVEYSVRDKDGNYVFNAGDEGSGWVPLGVVTPDVRDGSYTFTHTIEGLDYKQQYTITVNVIDKLTPVQTVSSVVAALPVFDWNGDDFHHHTDVALSNGRKIMGMTTDDEQIVALETCNINGDTTLGKGNYDAGEGNTRIYGNNIYLHPKEKLIINGKEYGAQRVLWSGASHMNNMQTISLAQTISEQPNGVVLVFSLYRDGAAEDVSFNTFFVSKHEVGLFPGDPHFFFMGINAGFSTIGAKYLYINDGAIGGHEGNTSSGTASGITFNNSNFVLRYVIGV